MKLTKRLAVLASLVTKDTIYDIGCDHALLDIFLCTYQNKKCYACDISKNALTYAKKNIEKNNLQDKIETIVSDGLKNVDVKENSEIVISGMGTSTVIDILKDKKAKKASAIILQSNNCHDELREFLSKNNYKIIEEIVISDKNIYYITMKVVKGKAKYNHKDLTFGPILRHDTSIDTLVYYSDLLKTKKEILKKVPRKYLGKKWTLKKEIKWLKKKLKKESWT
jgi:tRNA (adenine22-N1)-methyltransferase